jgi:hypothetical protein
MGERHIDPADWVPKLPSIPIGGKRRYPHDCGEGKPLVVFRGELESSAYCHRCGEVAYHREQLSVADMLRMQEKSRAAENAARASFQLPEAHERDPGAWPANLRTWFYKLGIGPAHIAAMGMYYNREIDRVVLPILGENRQVLYWTARHATRSPKWIGPDAPKAGLVAKYGVGRGDVLVLTEDPLSAYKVSLETEAWALMGTKLSDAVLLALLRDPRPAVIWLDNDQGRSNGRNPGQEAASKIRARLRAMGKKVFNVVSDADPKTFSRLQIRTHLEHATTINAGAAGRAAAL